jgi:hypothetical protein
MLTRDPPLVLRSRIAASPALRDCGARGRSPSSCAASTPTERNRCYAGQLLARFRDGGSRKPEHHRSGDRLRHGPTTAAGSYLVAETRQERTITNALHQIQDGAAFEDLRTGAVTPSA